MLTDQEVFDKVAVHLLTQRKKSEVRSGPDDLYPACLYRGPDGLKCAVGVLIPDSRYKKSIEGCSAFDSPVREALKGVCNNFELLECLQSIHDGDPIKKWARELRWVAKIFGLKTTAIKGMR